MSEENKKKPGRPKKVKPEVSVESKIEDSSSKKAVDDKRQDAPYVPLMVTPEQLAAERVAAESKQVIASGPKRKRRPMKDMQGPLNTTPIPGFRTRWVAMNDSGRATNVKQAMERGYVPVTPQEQGISPYQAEDLTGVTHGNSSSSTIVNTGRDGISLILMKIREEDFQEDLQDFKKYNDSQVVLAAKPKAQSVDGKQIPGFGESFIDGKPLK